MDIRNVTADDLPSLDLFAERIQATRSLNFTEDFFNWQFEESAAIANAGDNGFLIGMEGDKIVSYLAANKMVVWYEGQRIEGAWNHEWYSDPEAAGGGLFLMRQQISRNQFLGISGPSAQSINVFSRLRPTTWIELERLFAVVDVESTQDLMAISNEDVTRLLSGFKIASPKAGVTLHELSEFDDEYDRVWQSFQKNVSLCADRSSAFMQWRYCDHPKIKYRVVRTSGQAGTAYFVWREEQVKNRSEIVARLCEVIGTPEAVAAGFPLVWAEWKKANVAFGDFFNCHAPTLSGLIVAGMSPAMILDDFDLPRLFSPLATDPRKRLGFPFSLTRELGALAPGRHPFIYITKGDGNQDWPSS